MAKLIVYVCDVETTSLDETKGDIIEASFLRTSDMVQKTWFIKPMHPENIEDGALKKNGTNKDDLLWKTKEGREKYRELNKVLPEIENWIFEDLSSVYDRIICGHNIAFDERFLKMAWRNAGCYDSYPFSAYGNLIDTKSLALLFGWINNVEGEKYNLGACIKKYGIQKLKAHLASDDVMMTYNLFMHFVEQIKKGI